MRIYAAIVGLCLCCETFGILSGLDKDALLTAHNYYRSIVSPVAANMLKMRWSEKLEATAQSIANECTLKQSDSAVTLDSISLNKYVVTSSIPDYNSAVSQWFGENENYIYESNTCSNGCERYKKMVRSEAAYLGCAANRCPGFQDMSRLRGTLLVCAYGPIVGDASETPYRTGSAACEACPSDYQCLDSLCLAKAKTTSLTIKSDPVSSPNDSAPTETPKYSDAAKAKVMLEKHPLSAPKVSSPLYRALLDYSKEVAIILHTVNDNEYWAVMDRLLAPQSDTIPALGTPLAGSITFPTKGMVLGRFGGYKVAVVQTNMGAECRDEIEVALERFPNAQAIIGVGVAYGAKKYQYCDVLVSKWIEDLSTVKFDVGNNIITRGEKLEMRPWLVNIFTKQTGEFAIKQNFSCTADGLRRPQIAGGILFSASWLVDNAAVKSEIFENAPEAIGGEMEGWVLSSIERKLRNKNPPRNIGVIIIKGLADYGDGTKGTQWQFTAAKAAVDYTFFQLEDAGDGALAYPSPSKLAAYLREIKTDVNREFE
uniref:ATP N-glycosidase 1 n=1 Tax=Ephydatia muelleri TaxID=6052 RepID=A0A3Q9B4I4_EPHMU|nr:ATP N-glycosidase 1 [Ephydatia muelleri]